ncbi:Head-to-tail connector protein, podovirus-type [uncultured Caudovirales phage]|uniref:Head-to-tail connector protein, podovirus-type n=1 Tax=uncultured Caudovirales phage TaxID=2100421 RepID=A0A6J5P840_9CAUD|nr:Head-to-tail connector protein, podovirus-type [uncultured Caudovirales phage]
MDMTPQTAKSMYDEMTTVRQPYLDRARECAALTIPTLMPPEGSRGQSLPTPWQSAGAMGVNTLSNKMILALMPPNTPFFRLEMDEKTKAAVAQAGAAQDVQQILAGYEAVLMREVEEKADRVAGIEAIKQLINAGNVLVHVPPSGTMKVYKLDQYVVKRDRAGNALRIVIKECISIKALPAEIAAVANMQYGSDKRTDSTVDIYTVVDRLNRETFRVWQEVCDKQVPNSIGFVMADAMSYLPLRWARIDGEDYGRGFVEEYQGDLQSLEGLQKAVVEASAASAKLVYLRNPGATTSAEDFAATENGDTIDGVEGDFKVLQAEKRADMQGAELSIQRLEARLAKAFLMVSSVQRQAERVTAEEIRIMAGDLEDSLGGVYSTLTLEFQLPYVKRKIALAQMQGRLPHFPKGSVAPSIVTGIAALGRNHEVGKTMAWAQACSAVLGPEVFGRTINADAFMKAMGTGYGVQVAALVKTQEQLQAEAEQARQQQNVQTLGPELLRNRAQQSQPQ